jgi:hypothetical protein
LEPNKADVALYLAEWKCTGLVKYKPDDVAAQTFDTVLKKLASVHADVGE